MLKGLKTYHEDFFTYMSFTVNGQLQLTSVIIFSTFLNCVYRFETGKLVPRKLGTISEDI